MPFYSLILQYVFPKKGIFLYNQTTSGNVTLILFIQVNIPISSIIPIMSFDKIFFFFLVQDHILHLVFVFV